MSEHWKSTPKYWCKHCSCYVRDTKLERQNHEATAKHQSALKRFLRDLHRGHDREERDRERARKEIARLNGVISDSSATSSTSLGASREAQQRHDTAASASELKRQREQLAELGVSVPSNFRPEIALPGEWTVTNTRIIEDKSSHDSDVKPESKATGVRKRDATDQQKEEEEAIHSLFKKPRRWGRDTKSMPEEEDAELETLLKGTFPPVPSAGERKVKTEPNAQVQQGVISEDEGDTVKGLREEDAHVFSDLPEKVTPSGNESIKAEENLDSEADLLPPQVIFKKRKAKGIRQK